MNPRTEQVSPAADPWVTAPAELDELYARHAPDLERRSTDDRSSLRAAAHSHHRLAAIRQPGRQLVRVRPAEPTAAEPAADTVERVATVIEVVVDDMPFLVDSVLGAATEIGAEPLRVIHPIVVVRRDAAGKLTEVLAGADPSHPPEGAIAESWIHVDLAPDGPDAAAVEEAVDAVLHRVRAVVDDTAAMTARAMALAEALEATDPDSAALLRWLADGHFTFLGHRRGDGPGLGVLRDAGPADELPAHSDGPPVVLTRADVPGPLRPARPYHLAVRTAGAQDRFLGTLTVPAVYDSVLDIPIVADRVRGAIARAGLPLDSYSGQRMLEVLSGLPREELFAGTEAGLHDTAVGVLAATGRSAVRLFIRRDPYGRFISCLVYLPRDRYTTSSRLAMAEVLQRRLEGRRVDHTARVTESTLALVHFTVHTRPDAAEPDVDETALAAELTEAVRTWDDRLRSGPAGEQLAPLLDGVPAAYKAAVTPAQAVEDLHRVAALREPGDFTVRLYPGAEPGERRFTLYLAGAPATLTAILPLLQDLGVEVLDERPSEIRRPDGLRCWLYDFGLRLDGHPRAGGTDRAEPEFCAAFAAAWCGDAESDRFSALVLGAGLSWREVAVLRAYAHYTRQLGSPYGTRYIANTLLTHPDVARALIALFRARFDPARPADDRTAAVEVALRSTTALIDAVAGLDADRILRGYLATIIATLRTNWFRDREYFSFKIDPSGVADMPAPRPQFEIFVYAPRVEGVHLRFGRVARGGLRWSDRPQDYRTEILGLVKAQMVKNAVIVPVGAKGGFIVRAADPGPSEVEACYRIFISGLLDLTDDRVDGGTVPPPGVVRYDPDDSYLVVAADKGTARFSDTANAVAADYGFWLGDAFASGGSVGYDHKAMGITARGAWESVRRHFRERGLDPQTREFTVVGIGDMSGDVFGNGMLLSRHIRLLAAFDHRHVFVDPTPDAARSYAERERLFALPRSSWDDYDRSVISPGGGVWARTVKSVPVGPEIRAALGLPDRVEQLSPPELIRAILRAPADLLWNGGIGTYVKASEETHAAAGDKANDAVRADGRDLRVAVVGEGGNLGLTQRGRIEAARAGVRLNTDAIDNSAGVDCSDHEVNIKILLDGLVVHGELARDERETLLASMTDEVAELVLADNRSQNTVLGVARAHAPEMVGVHGRLVADLEARRGLDRELEVLPDADAFAALEAAGRGLTGPELATLLAHTKLDLTAQVLSGELPDTRAFAARLAGYFPTPLRTRFGAAIAAHPLRREIVSTLLVNEMVDGAGLSYAFRLGEELAAAPADAVRAYAVVTAVFDLPALWERLRAPGVPTAVADVITLESRRLLDRASRWFLTNRPQPLAVGAEISRFAGTVAALRARLPELLQGRERAEVERRTRELVADGVPADLAAVGATLVWDYGLLDVVELTELSERDREPREAGEVGALYYALSEHLGIDLALTSVSALERGDRWHGLARLALRDDLYGSLRAITLDALREVTPGTPATQTIAAWEAANTSRLARARAALYEVGTGGRLDLATLSVVSRQLRGLAR